MQEEREFNADIGGAAAASSYPSQKLFENNGVAAVSVSAGWGTDNFITCASNHGFWRPHVFFFLFQNCLSCSSPLLLDIVQLFRRLASLTSSKPVVLILLALWARWVAWGQSLGWIGPQAPGLDLHNWIGTCTASAGPCMLGFGPGAPSYLCLPCMVPCAGSHTVPTWSHLLGLGLWGSILPLSSPGDAQHFCPVPPPPIPGVARCLCPTPHTRIRALNCLHASLRAEIRPHNTLWTWSSSQGLAHRMGVEHPALNNIWYMLHLKIWKRFIGLGPRKTEAETE